MEFGLAEKLDKRWRETEHRRNYYFAALRECEMLVQKHDDNGLTSAPTLIYGGRGMDGRSYI